MLSKKKKYNLHRSSILAFLSVAVLIALCSLLISYNLKSQQTMLEASGISYELRLQLDRSNNQLELLLDSDGSNQLPERVIIKLRDDLISNANSINTHIKKLRTLLLESDDYVSAIVQTLDKKQAAENLSEIDRLWKQFYARVGEISRASIDMLRAGNRFWEPTDALVAHNGVLFSNMSQLNKLVYKASINQHRELRTLYIVVLCLVLIGLWLIWYLTLRPLAKRLNKSYQKIIQQNERLKFQANHDAMTTLFNRAAFNKRFDAMEKRQEGLQGCCLILIDLDEFKSINDNLGHQAGDEILKKVAKHMLEDCLSGEAAYRLGGDEFAMVMEGINDKQAIVERVDQLVARIRQPLLLDNEEIYTTCSLGISWCEAPRSSLEELFSAADAALYTVKERGRDDYCFFNDISHVSVSELLRFDEEIHRAIEQDEFIVHYQPIFNLRTNELYGFEALARWQHPERGLLLPKDWLPRAEKLSLDSAITLQVMEIVKEDYQKWQQMELKTFLVSINVTEKMLVNGSALKQLKSMSKCLSTDAQLGIEVTESIVLDRAFRIMKKQLELIHAAGINIALDDFGTGFANLSHLRRIPFDTIKLDMSFTSKILTDSGMMAIVKSLIDLSDGLNKKIVCEGVDNIKVRDKLIKMGCHYSQGFLHAKGLSFEDATTLMPKLERSTSEECTA